MKALTSTLLVLLATPVAGQTPPTDPATVMGRVLMAFAGIDRPPAEVMEAFLPEARQQFRVIGTFADMSIDVDDPQAIFFETFAPGADPPSVDHVRLTCIRFGPSTLALANDFDMSIPNMLMKSPQEGWIGTTAEDLPELGSPQAFPEGAVLRQDCVVRYGLPPDIPVQTLKDWPLAAIKAIDGRFGTLTTTVIGVQAPNTRLALRASDPQGDPGVQIRLMLGMMPYRPFDDVTLPAFGLELRAATYLFAPPS